MRQPRVALAALLMVLYWHSAASAQRARFVQAEEFDTDCIKAGQFVEVTYYTDTGKERQIKGFVRAIGETSFTVYASTERVVVPFSDLDVLIIGRLKPEIILIKPRPAEPQENRVRSLPGVDTGPGSNT